MIRNSLTGRQKRLIRSEGTKLQPVVMVGKDAVTPAVVQSARDVIRKRELIKVRVLNNCLEDASDVMELLAERCDANLVQIKGNTGLLFKRNFEKPKIELP